MLCTRRRQPRCPAGLAFRAIDCRLDRPPGGIFAGAERDRGLIAAPLFHYSDTWQLVINTGTTIVTFLMVFLIQNTQNRDMLAVQLKLSELVLAMKGAKQIRRDRRLERHRIAGTAQRLPRAEMTGSTRNRRSGKTEMAAQRRAAAIRTKSHGRTGGRREILNAHRLEPKVRVAVN